jgi:iron complex transport system substrate-binding protein
MKRRFAWLCITLLLVLAACGPAGAPTPAPAATPMNAPAAAPTTAPAIAPTNTPAAVPTSIPTAAYPLTITDSNDRKVTIAAQPQKIVSLSPSDTEIVYALGQGAKLVAVDQFSDYPPEAKSVLNIGGSRGNFNFEKIVALAPDLVLAAGPTAADTIKKLEDLKLTVVVISSRKTTLDSIMGDIKLAGSILGVPAQARQLTEAMQQRLDVLKTRVAAAKARPRVYWELDGTNASKPYTVGAGNFVHDLITLAGGENVFSGLSASFSQVGAETVVAANPEVIILSDAAYGISPESVKARSGWDVISAVKNGKVFPIDDNLVSRPGPRIVEGLEAAARLIHPELFP